MSNRKAGLRRHRPPWEETLSWLTDEQHEEFLRRSLEIGAASGYADPPTPETQAAIRQLAEEFVIKAELNRMHASQS